MQYAYYKNTMEQNNPLYKWHNKKTSTKTSE